MTQFVQLPWSNWATLQKFGPENNYVAVRLIFVIFSSSIKTAIFSSVLYCYIVIPPNVSQNTKKTVLGSHQSDPFTLPEEHAGGSEHQFVCTVRTVSH